MRPMVTNRRCAGVYDLRVAVSNPLQALADTRLVDDIDHALSAILFVIQVNFGVARLPGNRPFLAIEPERSG